MPEILSELLSGSVILSLVCTLLSLCVIPQRSGRRICNTTPSSRTFYAFTVLQVLEVELAPGLSDYQLEGQGVANVDGAHRTVPPNSPSISARST